MGGYSQGAMSSGGGGADSPESGGGPPSGGAAASTPGTQNPALRSALGQLTAMAQTAQQYAKAYPQCAAEMRQIADLLQKCLMKTTQAQQDRKSTRLNSSHT